ncbi:MAG TPA: diguanylate cyclase [Symbiobacteriaceae bacterium]|nr:diguanylate cyclase [Symbiobacteriaceae bacterium]
MRRYTPEALWFIAGVAALAAVGIWGAMGVGGPQPSYLPFFALTAGACLAHLYPIRSAREGAFYVLSNVFLFAGVELLPPLQFAGLGILALVPLTWTQRKRPGALIRFTFNASQSILAMLAAWSILRLGAAMSQHSVTQVGLILVAIVMFTAVQTACVVVIIALNSRIPLSRVEGINLTGFISDALMPFLGALFALVWAARPVMLFLFIPPLLAVYRLMRDVQLIRQADLDTKTGLYNYTYFVQRLGQTLQYARFVRQPTAVLFADMDLLREINNNHGHLAGDLAIKHVANVLLKELPQNAVVARFGGEEFVALLPGTHPEEAEFMGWRVCREIGRTPVDIGEGRRITVTASVGVAGYPEQGVTAEALVDAADHAVYFAKARGRNQVVGARSLTPEELKAPTVRPPAPPAGPGAQAPAVPPAAVTPAPRPTPPPPSAPVAPAVPVQAPGARPAGLPTLARLLIAGVGLGALATVTVLAVPMLTLGTTAVTLIVAGAIAGELFRLSVPDPSGKSHCTLTLTGGVAMVAGVLCGVPGAALASLVGALAHLGIHRQRAPEKMIFNVSSTLLSSVAAGALLQIAIRQGAIAVVAGLAVLAAVANFLVSQVLIATVVSITQRRDFGQTLMALVRASMAHYVVLGSLCAFMALGYRAHGVAGAAIFLLPAGVLYSNFAMHLRQSGERIAGLERARTELEAAQGEQKRLLDQMVVTLAGVIDARDASVSGHSLQVARYAEAVALELGLSAKEAAEIRLGGLLHDLGKIGVPEQILAKPGKLSPEEWVVMRGHAALGEKLLSEVSQLEAVARMVGEHHEYFSGRGYPTGKAGDSISIGGRILTVVDALDCMLTDRPYSKAKSLEWALGEFDRCAGDQFDPAVVAALKRLVDREGEAFFTTPDKR